MSSPGWFMIGAIVTLLCVTWFSAAKEGIKEGYFGVLVFLTVLLMAFAWGIGVQVGMNLT